MSKLFDTFASNPTQKNAMKLVTYLRNHPMCKAMMNQEQFELFKKALDTM